MINAELDGRVESASVDARLSARDDPSYASPILACLHVPIVAARCHRSRSATGTVSTSGHSLGNFRRSSSVGGVSSSMPTKIRVGSGILLRLSANSAL